jgi:hypothetical protein
MANNLPEVAEDLAWFGELALAARASGMRPAAQAHCLCGVWP